MDGCHLTYMASIEGATWGVVRAFWPPKSVSTNGSKHPNA